MAYFGAKVYQGKTGWSKFVIFVYCVTEVTIYMSELLQYTKVDRSFLLDLIFNNNGTGKNNRMKTKSTILAYAFIIYDPLSSHTHDPSIVINNSFLLK